jgi:hypothetical protein
VHFLFFIAEKSTGDLLECTTLVFRKTAYCIYDVPSTMFETENEFFIAGYCPVDKQSDDMVTFNPIDGLFQ